MLIINDILNFLDNEKIIYRFTGDKNYIIDGPYIENSTMKNFYYIMKKEDYHIKIGLLISRFEIATETENVIITENSKYVFYHILSKLFSKEESFEEIYYDLKGVKNIDRRSSINHNVIFGKNINIGPNNSLGGRGFTYYEILSKKYRINPFGKLVIFDNVDIGKSCVIDRGNILNTIIGKNTKIDSHVYIAHDVKVGSNCIITSKVSINGFSSIGDNCYLGSGCIIRNNISIGNNTTVGMGAVVTHSFEDNLIIVGNPATINAHKCSCGFLNRINGNSEYTCSCGNKYKIFSDKVIEI